MPSKTERITHRVCEQYEDLETLGALAAMCELEAARAGDGRERRELLARAAVYRDMQVEWLARQGAAAQTAGVAGVATKDTHSTSPQQAGQVQQETEVLPAMPDPGMYPSAARAASAVLAGFLVSAAVWLVIWPVGWWLVRHWKELGL